MKWWKSHRTHSAFLFYAFSIAATFSKVEKLKWHTIVPFAPLSMLNPTKAQGWAQCGALGAALALWFHCWTSGLKGLLRMMWLAQRVTIRLEAIREVIETNHLPHEETPSTTFLAAALPDHTKLKFLIQAQVPPRAGANQHSQPPANVPHRIGHLPPSPLRQALSFPSLVIPSASNSAANITSIPPVSVSNGISFKEPCLIFPQLPKGKFLFLHLRAFSLSLSTLHPIF